MKGFDSIDLPDPDALRDRLDTYFEDKGGLVGLPSDMRKDINWLIDSLYAGLPATDPKRSVIVGATEAIVLPDGSRPVFFFENNNLVTKGKPNGPFVDAAARVASGLAQVSQSVGRIETDDRRAPSGLDVYYDGTGFLVAPNLVMTNRHVMERIVNEPDTSGPFTLKYDYWINFDGQLGGSTARRVKISDVVFAGPVYIGEGGDFTRLDMALLRLGAPADATFVPPQPLNLSSRALSKDATVALIGFPAPPQIYVGTGVPPANTELESVLQTVFDKRFGYKRCATGAIIGAPGSDAADTKRWVTEHDASTLGGNSGSPVLDISAASISVVALHFFGQPRKANFAHVFEQLSVDLGRYGVVLQP